MKPINAIILCAGKGSRMDPLSKILPKPLLPIQGRPVLEWNIEALSIIEGKIGIIINEHDKIIFDKFVKEYLTRPDIDIFIQSERTGVVSAILSAHNYKDKSFIAMAGDTKFNSSNVRELINILHEDEFKSCLGITKRSPEEIARRSNVILQNEESMRVKKLIEKPQIDNISSSWSGLPIWAFDVSSWKFLHNTPISKRGEFDIADTYELMLKAGMNIKGIEIDDTKDLTYPKDVLLHNFDYISDLIDTD